MTSDAPETTRASSWRAPGSRPGTADLGAVEDDGIGHTEARPDEAEGQGRIEDHHGRRRPRPPAGRCGG